ncbi:MAG: DsrE family protein [Haloferacaceae archaeon]
MRTAVHLSSPTVVGRERALRSVPNLVADGAPADEVRVVAHAGGVRALRADAAGETERRRVAALREAGVGLAACRNTLDGSDAGPADLLAGVEVVPSGVGALARRQAEGWGYLKLP